MAMDAYPLSQICALDSGTCLAPFICWRESGC